MAVQGVGNLVNNVANQLFAQTQGTQAANPNGAANAVIPAVTEDTFTPSTQNAFLQATAQDAGLFQISQAALTTISANILFGQPNPNANQVGAPAETASPATTNVGAPQTATSISSTPPGNATQPAASNAAAAAANVEIQLQTLNAALPALGLTNQEIQQIDLIASLVHDFNPATYANLVTQFEARAQQAAQQSPAIAAASANIGALLSQGAGANGGGFQVQGISLQFAGAPGPVNNAVASGGGAGTAGNNPPANTTGLQIAQVQFTFVNRSGQTVQVQTPPQTQVSALSRASPEIHNPVQSPGTWVQ